MGKKIDSIEDLQPDTSNANKGTERGRYMVEASLREVGAGRSIVADKNGKIVAGNKTLEAWTDIGGEIEIVHTDGKKLVVVQRDDLDLSDDTGAARKLAYYDNRAGEVGLEWDAEQLLADINAGVDLTAMFFSNEQDEILGKLRGEPQDPNELWKGMPAFEQEDKGAFRTIIVHFEKRSDVDDFARIMNQTLTDKTKSIWHPYKPHEVLKDIGYKDES